MSTEVTRKFVAQHYDCCAVGYVDLYYLLACRSRDYYTTGIYGWNFDVYTFYSEDGTGYAITTGYRGMINNCKNDYSFELGRTWNDKARRIYEDQSLSYEKRQQIISKLLSEFLGKVFGKTFNI